MEVIIIILLSIICYMLFDIRSRMPERDYVQEALLRDKKEREAKEQGQNTDL